MSGKTTQLMLMMLASCLLKSAQVLGRWVLQASGAQGAGKTTQLMIMMLASCLLNSSQSLGRWFCKRLELRGPCEWENNPADAHDARLLPPQICAITRAVGFASVWSLGGHASGKTTQLMLMMLASCLLKSAQSLGRWVLQVCL